MTKREKIRDAILGISKTEIESVERSRMPIRLESGEMLNDKKWKNMSKWAGCKREQVIVYYDNTLLGSAKEGGAFTDEAFWVNESFFEVPKAFKRHFEPLRYADIRGIRQTPERPTHLYITFDAGEVEVYSGIYANFLAEALKRILSIVRGEEGQEKTAGMKKSTDEKRPEKAKKTAEKPSASKAEPQPVPAVKSAPEEQPASLDIAARIAAIERELNALYARKAELEAEEAAARKAAEEAAARKAAEEAAEIEEEEDLFEEDEDVEIAQEAVLDGKIAKAIQRYEKAAAAGNATAMCELGSLYGDDMEMDRDAEKAFYWYDLADRHGDIMGAVFAAGLAIEIARTFEDLEIAEGWIARAEAKGQHKNAQNLKNKLLKKQREIERQVDAEDPVEEAAARKATEEAAARKATEEAAARKAAEEAAARKAAEEAAARKAAEEAAAKKAAEEAAARKAAEEAAARKAAEEAAARKAAEEAAARKAAEEAAARKAAEEAAARKAAEEAA